MKKFEEYTVFQYVLESFFKKKKSSTQWSLVSFILLLSFIFKVSPLNLFSQMAKYIALLFLSSAKSVLFFML